MSQRSRTGCFLACALLLSSCDGSFRSRSHDAGSDGLSKGVSFSFAGGESSLEVDETGAVAMRAEFPRVGYSLAADVAAGTVDPARIVLRSNPRIDAASENLMQRLVLEDRVQLELLSPDRLAIHLDFPILGLFDVPIGLVVLELFVLDDIDRASASVFLELTVRSAERPTLSLRMEVPPPAGERDPSGALLPVDDTGTPVIGHALPFVLVVAVLPATEGDAGFDQLFVNGIDPDRFLVVADQDLGDLAKGGIAAGENLAPLFDADFDVFRDPDGGFVVAALFARDGPFSPRFGTVEFSAIVVDDRGVSSDPRSAELEVEAVISLADAVHPLLARDCTSIGCHGDQFPVFGMDLSTPESSFLHLVGVRAVETPDSSCATLRVQVYDAMASYLVAKLDGRFDEPCVDGAGSLMPLGGEWTPEEIDLLSRWIRQGAFGN